MEINNDIAPDLPQLVTRTFSLPAVEADARSGVDVYDDTALLECLDGESWN